MTNPVIPAEAVARWFRQLVCSHSSGFWQTRADNDGTLITTGGCVRCGKSLPPGCERCGK